MSIDKTCFANNCRVFNSLMLAIIFSPSLTLADLQPLSDQQLASSHGQFQNQFVRQRSTESDIPQQASDLGLSRNALNLTQGIEIDLAIQASLDMTYEDPDGYIDSQGNAGEAGVIGLSGIHIGNKQEAISANDVRSDQVFTPNELAIVENIFIDTDPVKGMFITIEEMGDSKGNGIDIVINDLYLGNPNLSAGGLLIENLSNFMQNHNVEQINQLFGQQLTSLDDGRFSQSGNWIDFNAIVLSEASSESSTLLPPELNNDELGIPGLSANTTISASFVLHIDKLAWVDSDENGINREFGLAGLTIYQGVDTNNDGMDDTIGPAILNEMKIETVEHTSFDGRNVQALYIDNLDFKADIAIASIYVGNPTTGSLGALQIQGLDTAGTRVWIYDH
ncbi:hypothetical protein [Bermanella sp. R86510]|uniref:hypothetical protein n=1 Tax=unclassified Bermanella TaxID=2627862 RepID=UPI0037C7D74A